MSNKILLSVTFLLFAYFGASSPHQVEVESFRRPMVEKNNVINKGVWIRSQPKEQVEIGKMDDFLFKPSSLDAMDNLLQGDFTMFGESHIPGLSYVERSRRQIDDSRSVNQETDDPRLVESKIISKLRPASVFNDYPFEIAVLLDNTKKDIEFEKNISDIFQNANGDANNNLTLEIETLANNNLNIKDIYNISGSNDTATLITLPVHAVSVSENNENKLIEPLELNDVVNVTNESSDPVTNKVNRDTMGPPYWQQRMPVEPRVNNRKYPITPMGQQKKVNKPISEKGLSKILSILTKTFKKIMRQHEDIKGLHLKMNSMNKEFQKNAEDANEKLKRFDGKYKKIYKVSEEVKKIEERLVMKENQTKHKESHVAKTLQDFENHQKKFLAQQKQFYNIQKMMLVQNEKISQRQNQIAKTQSEISHRQNNFARILKKAKQIYIDNNPNTQKITTTIDDNPFNSSATTPSSREETTTMGQPRETTETVKINLFSIPALDRLVNQDHLILNEKDDQPVDELVYKYYFNNTFIDSLIKNKILTSAASNGENFDSRNVKNKRNEASDVHTILLPVGQLKDILETVPEKNLNRKRRWIQHSTKNSRRHRGKGKLSNREAKDTQNPGQNLLNAPPTTTGPLVEQPTVTKNFLASQDPFVAMATNFCVGIGQNVNRQVLSWCVEKALRKLQNIDTGSPHPVEVPATKQGKKPQRLPNAQEYIQSPTTSSSSVSQSASENTFEQVTEKQSTVSEATTRTQPTVPSHISENQHTDYQPPNSNPAVEAKRPAANLPSNINGFFPDNDQLESNLRKYDMNIDTEGNVYYEGSLHASAILPESEGGFSDIMRLESNSKIDVDTATFDIQAKRRAFLRKIYEKNNPRRT